MTKMRDLNYNDRLPEMVMDSLMEFISTMHSNFGISLASSTTLQVVAGVDNAQAVIGINGRWRYNSATVNAAHPGGAAGTYDIYVTAADNSFAPSGNPPGMSPETDSTVYSFGLAIRAVGSPPATALYRKVGSLTWDGAQITDFVVTTGWSRHHTQHEPGGSDPISPYLLSQVTTLQGTLASRPTAATANSGFTYLATDVNGGTTYRSNGTAWTQQSAGVTHAVLHAPGGTDALPWTTIHGYGTLAARPAAASTNTGYLYYATDTATIYRSNGTSWDSETANNSSIAQAIHLFGTLAARPSAAGANQGFYYWASDTNGGTLYQNQSGSAWTTLFETVPNGGSLATASTLTTTDEFHTLTGTTTVVNIATTGIVTGQKRRFMNKGGGVIMFQHSGGGNMRLQDNLHVALVSNESIELTFDGTNWIESNRSAIHVSGQSVDMGGFTGSPGLLAEDGSAISRTTYAALWGNMASTWGVGDGSTTFNLPDTRGRANFGWAQSGGHADVSTVGFTEGVTLSSRRPKHNTSVKTNPAISVTAGGNTTIFDRNAVGGGDSGGAATGTTVALAGSASGGSYGPQTGAEPTDTVPYAIRPRYTRV